LAADLPPGRLSLTPGSRNAHNPVLGALRQSVSTAGRFQSPSARSTRAWCATPPRGARSGY